MKTKARTVRTHQELMTQHTRKQSVLFCLFILLAILAIIK